MLFVAVFNKTNGVKVAGRVEVADTSLRRMVGLLGKGSLAPEEGLWIKPSSGVHTIGMSFPIDVVGLDKNLTVVKMWSNLAPYRLTSLNWSVRSVIELPAGTIIKRDIRLADIVALTPHRVTQTNHAELSVRK